MNRLWFAILCFGVSLESCMARNVMQMKCREHQFLMNGKCQDCPPCPAGSQNTPHCGYAEDSNGVVRKTGKRACEPCNEGEYKTASMTRCWQCELRCPQGKAVLQQCNSTSNLRCSDKCQPGYYESGPDKDCVQCSYCCGYDYTEDYSKRNFIKQCQDAGMGICSCRPLIGCNTTPDKCNGSGHDAQLRIPDTPTAATATAVTSKRLTTLGGVQSERSSERTAQELDANKPQKELHVGWAVAIVIAVVLIITIGALLIMRYHVCKKIKSLVAPGKPSSPRVFPVYHARQSPTSMRVGAYLAFKPEPNITNMAQRMYPTEEQDECYLGEHSNEKMQCTCLQDNEAGNSQASNSPPVTPTELSRLTSSSDEEEHAHELDLQNSPPTRVAGQYVQMISRNEQMCDEKENPGPGSTENQEKHKEDEDPGMHSGGGQGSAALEAHQEEDAPKDETEKGKEEQEQEVALSVPATGRGEDKVVIATGHNQELIAPVKPLQNAAPQEELKCTCSADSVPKITTPVRTTTKANGKRQRKTALKKTTTSTADVDTKSLQVSASPRCTCGKCIYRPLYRDSSHRCYCSECSPQPSDYLFKVFERNCLKETICKELNKKGISNWRDIISYMREDKRIGQIEQEPNPTAVVLSKLKANRPEMKLSGFNEILKKIGRHDVIHAIYSHRFACGLCIRNSFDASLDSCSL